MSAPSCKARAPRNLSTASQLPAGAPPQGTTAGTERRGRLAPALHGGDQGRAARRRSSLARTRRAAAELAAHRRRLLELSAARQLDPSDALLLRVPAASTAALSLADLAHPGSKRSASDSRPPVFGAAINGTTATGASAAPARQVTRTDLQPTDRQLAQRMGFAAREGEGASASPTAPLLQEGENAVNQLQER